MKARLDHVGIAVKNLEEALRFYRDALGLEIEGAEEVAEQRVRAHFVPVGEAALELLEGTAPDSPIARYVDKRGPGLHHITLRVDDLHAVLSRLKEKGVRLIDAEPRPGAEGKMVAFVHPSAAHGVLVELCSGGPSGPRTVASTPPAVPLFRTPTRYTLGDLELISLSDGFFHLDGGAMFGVVPRALWEKRLPPDDLNRIPLAMRPLVVRSDRHTVIIDAGCGDKMDARSADLYGLDRTYHLDHSMREAGLSPDDIDIVIASHLHFDHVGGCTARRSDGQIVPRFPRARYVVHRGEWDDATHPHERSRASYLQENFVPLAEVGVLDLVEDDAEIVPGVCFRRSGGHTRHHQVVTITSGGKTAVFAADMFPTSAHVPDPWIMAYDLYPMDTLAFKRGFAREAIEREYLIFFEHEPSLAAGVIRERGGKRLVERVI